MTVCPMPDGGNPNDLPTSPSTHSRRKLGSLLRLAVWFAATLTLPAFAYAPVVGSTSYLRDSISCEFPVRLAYDCSNWQGATRPIAVGDYRLKVAAGPQGKTVFVSKVHHGPDHNGSRFRSRADTGSRETRSRAVINLIGKVLEARGIRLERTQPLRRGAKVDGYYLEFSGNAYDYLKQLTVLESEHWLP